MCALQCSSALNSNVINFNLKHNSVQRNLPFIKMAFIKEESEEMKIEEAFSVKEEDTEEQTGWFLIKGELGHCILLMLTTAGILFIIYS